MCNDDLKICCNDFKISNGDLEVCCNDFKMTSRLVTMTPRSVMMTEVCCNDFKVYFDNVSFATSATSLVAHQQIRTMQTL
jgi:hypothetical protein